jgi:pimeloyl-ACP methyl ester carboxylesterase
VRATIALAAIVAAAAALAAAASGVLVPRAPIRIVTIQYRAWDGLTRNAYVVLPVWYGPRRNPPIPLVISPHGRGVPARDNVRFWGDLPAAGRFAVVNPEGQGRRLALYSWGDPGEISDLARMPAIVRRALPWLRIAPHRSYAVGGSMGGQETLLLMARHPHELAGAISFDADTNLALRYRDFGLLRSERGLQPLPPLRGRRHAVERPGGVRDAEPARGSAGDRILRGATRALVERPGPGSDGAAAKLGRAVPANPAAQP